MGKPHYFCLRVKQTAFVVKTFIGNKFDFGKRSSWEEDILILKVTTNVIGISVFRTFRLSLHDRMVAGTKMKNQNRLTAF